MTDIVEEWFADIDKQISLYDKYRTRGRKIIDKYRDFSENIDRDTLTSLRVSYNLLYSNTEILKPVLYNRTPRAEVRAVNKTNKEARLAAEILEDTLNISCQNYDFDKVIQQVRDDYLLPGTGIPRVVYNPIISEDENGEDEVIFEEVFIAYESWDNVIFGNARIWDDLPWIAIRSMMRKAEVEDLLGKSIANELTYSDQNEIDSPTDESSAGRTDQVEIYEVWDKDKRERLFITRQNNKLLSKDDDPLELKGFFPIPRPLYSNTTNNTLIPIPFYVYYQDLQVELETISTRISNLIRELKRRGIYNSTIENIKDLIDAGDNVFVASDNFNRFVQQGGIDSVIFEIDISRIAQVLQGLYQQRDQVRFAIFEIMGISDIQRAVVDPRETATATRAKSNFGSLRVSEMQREIQRVIRDCYEIKAEIITTQFSARSIQLITSRPIEEINTALSVLKNQEPRAIKVDIETDSTIQSNEEVEQSQAVEFTRLITELGTALPTIAQTLGLDFSGELVLSVIRKFKMSRGLEDVLEQQIEQIKQQEEQAKNQAQNQEEQPNPDLIRAQNESAKVENDRIKLQLDAGKAQAENQLRIAELQLKQAELQFKAQQAEANLDLQESKQALEAAKLILEKDKLDVEAAEPGNQVVGV